MQLDNLYNLGDGMSVIEKLLTGLVNSVHNKVDLITNDWTRRSVGLFVFLAMAVIAVVGCLIELFVLNILGILKQVCRTTAEYLAVIKDDAIAFVERYIDLW
jgi:hypothetical protein|tara:strand:+ start:483 stop:788 length:306 start_codon:yes stop_codon:yes gene_type:complete